MPLAEQTHREWIINVTLEKFALGGGGEVRFYLGPPKMQVADHPDTSANVGSFVICADAPTDCPNCQQQADNKMEIGGTVELTDALIKYRLPLTLPDAVTFLKQHLRWHIRTNDKKEIPVEAVPSLKVLVQSVGYVTYFELIDGKIKEMETVREEWISHTEVTEGKAGGVKTEAEFYSMTE